MRILKTLAAVLFAALGIWMIRIFIDASENGIILVQPTIVRTMLVMGIIFVALSTVVATLAWSTRFENMVNRGINRLINPPASRRRRVRTGGRSGRSFHRRGLGAEIGDRPSPSGEGHRDVAGSKFGTFAVTGLDLEVSATDGRDVPVKMES